MRWATVSESCHNHNSVPVVVKGARYDRTRFSCLQETLLLLPNTGLAADVRVIPKAGR